MKVLFVISLLITLVVCNPECDDVNRKKRDLTFVCNVFDGVANYIPTDYGCDQICCGNALYAKADNVACCGKDEWGAVYDPTIDKCCSYEYTKSFQIHLNSTNPVNFCCGTDLFTPDHYRTSGCCNGWDNYNNVPAMGGIFNWMTEMCCEGNVSFVGDTAFGACCGHVGYDRRNDSCPCNNQLLGRGIKHEEARCCGNSENGTVPYNYKLQSCCNGNVVSNPTGIPTDNLICCNDQIMPVTGQKVCCDGVISDGDSCCNGNGYDSANGICCQGSLGAGPYKWGSCCGSEAYDAYNSTCCGLQVLPNPLIQVADTFVTSHNTRCCGDFNSVTPNLQPYDYFTSACCNGVVQQFGNLNSFNALCCNTTLLNGTSQLCCDNTPVDKIYGEDTACCNNQPMMPTQECCGGVVMDPLLQICCDGVARNLNGVPPSLAICCGEGCVDGRDYYCCGGKQVQKSDLSNVQDGSIDILDCVTLNL